MHLWLLITLNSLYTQSSAAGWPDHWKITSYGLILSIVHQWELTFAISVSSDATGDKTINLRKSKFYELSYHPLGMARMISYCDAAQITIAFTRDILATVIYNKFQLHSVLTETNTSLEAMPTTRLQNVGFFTNCKPQISLIQTWFKLTCMSVFKMC